MACMHIVVRECNRYYRGGEREGKREGREREGGREGGRDILCVIKVKCILRIYIATGS